MSDTFFSKQFDLQKTPTGSPSPSTRRLEELQRRVPVVIDFFSFFINKTK